MSDQTRKINDATASTKGTIYQLYVAVQKCYEMVSGQKVLIEKEGDVTIDGEQQVETKLVSTDLTDGNVNFWKTLRNWTQPGFDDAAYSSLILFTTQKFGKDASIKNWHQLSVVEKESTLTNINSEFEKSHSEKSKAAAKKVEPSEVLKLQREVLDSAKREKLTRILGKFAIEAGAPDLPELHKAIKEKHIKGILEGKKDDFLGALFSFVIRAENPSLEQWEISYHDFEKKVGELITLYCRETRIFPVAQFQNKAALADKITEHDQHNFVRKIKEIEHHAVIAESIRDYLGAVQTIKEEFAKYEVSPSRSTEYAEEILNRFEKHYRIASTHCSDVMKDSRVFFDERTAEPPMGFAGFADTPLKFRNGVLHIHMDDETKSIKWKLTRNE